ncbi:MAG: hypothetical protein ACXAEX_11480 [Promethearchaeota archaeon]|jgi:hypothetical protein
MGIETDIIPELSLLACPFADICILPKYEFICKIPECKICSDYISRAKTLKSRTLY